MARLSQAKVALVFWTSLFLFCAIGAGAAGGPESASTDPITVIPADSLFCVRINNLSGVATRIDQFLTGISAKPVNVSALVPAQLGGLLGSPEAKGINLSGSFAVFGPLPGGDVPDVTRIAVLIPVSDYKQFLEGNPNVAPPDAEGISAIGPKEQPMFAATNMAGYVLATSANNRQPLIEMKKLLAGPGATGLAKRLSPEELKRAQTSPVWAYANIQTVSKMFGPMIQAMLQQATKGMQEMQGQAVPGQAGAVMDMYTGMLNAMMQQTQFVSLSLDPSADSIRAGFVTAAVPNTEMAKILQGDSQTPDKKFLPYLENGAVMNIIMSMDPAAWNRVNNFYFDLLAKLSGPNASGENISKLKRLTTDATNALTGTLAGSFSVDAKAKPPFRLQYVLGMKDPQAFYRVLEEALAMLESGPIADLMKQSGMALKFELKRKVETYKDVPIDAFKISINPTDPNSQQTKMFTTMFGNVIEGRLAVVNNLLVYAIAGDPATGVRKLVDQAKGGGTQAVPSEVQAAMQLIPGSEKACFFATYNYLRVLQMVTAIMPMPMPQTPVQSQSNIAIAGKATGGSLSIELAVPKQHVKEITNVFMQMQQQQPKMQEQQPEQPKQKPSQGQPQRQVQTVGQT
jgi:hypothetical protein